MEFAFFFFRGYHQDPERAAERFVAEGRYYLTGDRNGTVISSAPQHGSALEQ